MSSDPPRAGRQRHPAGALVDFDITRSPNDHLAFGGGPHFCLGAHVGRIEISALLREILLRLPDLTPNGPLTWQSSVFISGPREMPVRF